MDDDDLIEPLPDRVAPKIASRIMACMSYQPERRPDAFDLLRSIKWHKAGPVPSPTPTSRPTPSASGTPNPWGTFVKAHSSVGTGSRDRTLASAAGAHNPFRKRLTQNKTSEHTQFPPSTDSLVQNMHITVRTPVGKTIDLHLEDARIVFDIMEKIQKVGKIPLAEQNLFFETKGLQPERTIASYNIQSGSRLHLIRLSLSSGTRNVTSTDKYPIYVRDFHGGVTKIDVSRSWTVATLLDALDVVGGAPATERSLIYAGLLLDRSRTLSDYDIGEDSTVHCLL